MAVHSRSCSTPFRLGLGGPFGDGTQWMSWIAVDDLVSSIDLIIRTPAMDGPVNLASPGSVTNAEFARMLGDVLHRPAVLRAPAFALRLALGEIADAMLLSGQRVVPRKLLEAGYAFRHPTLGPALRFLLAGG